jgi:hypothetical protein
VPIPFCEIPLSPFLTLEEHLYRYIHPLSNLYLNPVIR